VALVAAYELAAFRKERSCWPMYGSGTLNLDILLVMVMGRRSAD
jgi:hypothetical protein